MATSSDIQATTNSPMSATTTHHMKMKPMWMWFHSTINDVVLFESWTITTPLDMVWSCFVVMALGVLLEFIRYIRWRIGMSETLSTHLSANYISRLFSSSHMLQTLFFGVQQVIAYSLMLVFMTFSIWLGIAVCLGTGIGFLLFGSRQPR
ncbi:hypothetical protein KIN20_003841 [Parelaphostrongylus tenuis]|uniref:Copper transport protein n=1 Tax=Parelaphostrongylus tenuis TaxID=148309 RepID=A0AAD5MQH7_PARTN|nr:hypothetical protein KIN20_003841 [Parelaphostrongylus tenuis]